MRALLYRLLILGCLVALSALAVDTPPPVAKPPEGALEEFVPTEKVPVDSALSFPVDI